MDSQVRVIIPQPRNISTSIEAPDVPFSTFSPLQTRNQRRQNEANLKDYLARVQHSKFKEDLASIQNAAHSHLEAQQPTGEIDHLQQRLDKTKRQLDRDQQSCVAREDQCNLIEDRRQELFQLITTLQEERRALEDQLSALSSSSASPDPSAEGEGDTALLSSFHTVTHPQPLPSRIPVPVKLHPNLSPPSDSYACRADDPITHYQPPSLFRHVERGPNIREPTNSPTITSSTSSISQTDSSEEISDSHKQNSKSMDHTSIPSSLCPEPFSGHENDDASIWLNRIHIYTQLRAWSPEQTLNAFPLFLRDAAAIWYDTLDPTKKATVENLTQAFKERYFPHTTLRWVKLDQFNTRQQQPDESTTTYTQKMIKLGKDIDKSDKEIMEACVRGYRPYIKTYVLEKEPKSLEEALRFARVAEAFRQEQSDVKVLQALSEQMKDFQNNVTKEIATIRSTSVMMAAQPPQNLSGMP